MSDIVVARFVSVYAAFVGEPMAANGIFESETDKRRKKMSPRELYADCEAAEKHIVKNPPKAEAVASRLLFNGRIFVDEPIGGRPDFREIAKYGEPFHILVAPTKVLRQPRESWRYKKILQILKQQPDMELRWLLIANWLGQEGVCESSQFLPAQVKRNLIKRRLQQELPLSSTDLYHRSLIRNWLIYFERIRYELNQKASSRRALRAVCALGFRRIAVEHVQREGSTEISAICHWLAGRSVGDERKLRNSYSRLHSRSQKRALEEWFYNMPARYTSSKK
jgi:hypothetical protein